MNEPGDGQGMRKTHTFKVFYRRMGLDSSITMVRALQPPLVISRSEIETVSEFRKKAFQKIA